MRRRFSQRTVFWGVAFEQKEKWFQVIRFPASLPAVMTGTKLRGKDCRAFRLSAHRLLVSPAYSSSLPGSPHAISLSGPQPRNGLSLA
jgi:hypothetical protein